MEPTVFKEPKSGQRGSLTSAVSGAQKVGNGDIILAILGCPTLNTGDEITSGKQNWTKLVKMFLAYLKSPKKSGKF